MRYFLLKKMMSNTIILLQRRRLILMDKQTQLLWLSNPDGFTVSLMNNLLQNSDYELKNHSFSTKLVKQNSGLENN